jgi:hypothetical protein
LSFFVIARFIRAIHPSTSFGASWSMDCPDKPGNDTVGVRLADADLFELSFPPDLPSAFA